MKEENFEKIGQITDRMEAVARILDVPGISPEIHINSIKALLPEYISEIRNSLVDEQGENPWD